jgi:hypothetical protein
LKKKGSKQPLTKAGGRRQEAGGTLFVTGIYAPLQKLFALKGEVLDLIFSIIILKCNQ